MYEVIIINNNRLCRIPYVDRINVCFRQTRIGFSPINYLHQSNAIVMKSRLDEKYTSLRFSYVSDHHVGTASLHRFFSKIKIEFVHKQFERKQLRGQNVNPSSGYETIQNPFKRRTQNDFLEKLFLNSPTTYASKAIPQTLRLQGKIQCCPPQT